MAVYNVGIVREELREVWSEYWDRDEPTARALEASRAGLLDRTIDVEAENAADAIAKVQRGNPGCVAITDACQRIDPRPASACDA
jgi:hypothetical protein